MDFWQFCTSVYSALNAVAAELALLVLAYLAYQLRQMRRRVEEQLLAVSKVITTATDYLNDQMADLFDMTAEKDAAWRPKQPPSDDPSQPDFKSRIWTAWKNPDAP